MRIDATTNTERLRTKALANLVRDGRIRPNPNDASGETFVRAVTGTVFRGADLRV